MRTLRLKLHLVVKRRVGRRICGDLQTSIIRLIKGTEDTPSLLPQSESLPGSFWVNLLSLDYRDTTINSEYTINRDANNGRSHAFAEVVRQGLFGLDTF